MYKMQQIPLDGHSISICSANFTSTIQGFIRLKKTIQGFIETLADDLPPYPIARAPYYPTLLLYIPHLILPIIHDCNRRVIGASLGIHDAIYSNWRSGKAEAVTTNQQRSLQT
jgi:hypothetical protein